MVRSPPAPRRIVIQFWLVSTFNILLFSLERHSCRDTWLNYAMNGNKPTYKGPRDLPIYTAAYKLLEVIDRIFDNFTRDRKHTLGQTLYNTVLDLFECIRIANDFPIKRE